jgi:acetolactate synthase-1/2/3 large subunit
MKVKVSDYIADFLVKNNITNIFTVVGGGAMHMNNSFGHHPQLKCTYNHHEQAAAMAAEAYARVNEEMAAVCVTSGPGGINAMNGVAGAYMDSIPMLVFSGQMKREMTTRYTKLPVRSLGSQEFDVVSAEKNMTKFAEMIDDASKIRYYLEKMLYIARNGRPGPCWLDVPLDIQGAIVQTEDLQGFDSSELPAADVKPNDGQINTVIEQLKKAERPVLYAGNGIRLAKAIKPLFELIEKIHIPVVTCWDSVDIIATEHPDYCGRGGIMGDRAGNFAVQNSDFLLCIGTRLNILQVGYNVKTWARAAYTVMVDIDEAELQKPTVRVDLPICADAREFLQLLNTFLPTDYAAPVAWGRQCQQWKLKYPVVHKEQYEEAGLVNVYAFIDTLSRCLPEGNLTVVANGSASVVGSQTWFVKKDGRFILNCAVSSMGYDLPAAIGVSVGSNNGEVYCIAGDGSIMMNLQELQTIVTNGLPIKIFVINNQGYHQIRQTQNNMFSEGLVGVGPESKDLGFPSFERLAEAFGIPYVAINSNAELEAKLSKVINKNGFALCEVFVSIQQKFEPKSATKRLPDGRLISPPLEDLAPFLSREELKENMYIPLIGEE